jgi:3-methyl-2-oxobutanoate hydroxymethyltransferase
MNKITLPELLGRKKEGRKITMITAYDYPFARIADESGVDIVLIGDSLGMVVQGQPNTLGVTMEEMLYHTRMVARGVSRAMVVGDMPFLSFQVSVEETIRNAGLFLQAGAAAVKLEGGSNVRDRIEALAKMDIPVMAHVGLTPQSYHRLGGFKVQGGAPERAEAILAEAKAAEAAGAFAIVLEGIPMALGRRITESLSIPTIGIGAGPHCDGQVLVLYDLLGLFDRKRPTFVRQFANLREQTLEAIRRYKEEVDLGKFPSEDESYR